MNFEVKDLTGLGQPMTKLLEVIQAACGKIFEPTHIKRIAKAEAESHKLLERAKTEAQIETGNLIDSASPTTILSIPGIPLEIAQRAQMRLAHQEGLKQLNIEQVVSHAVANLPVEVSNDKVDADWATRFFSVASEVSDADMQVLWGKILAGETSVPGSYSVRTLDVLRNLSRNDAETFRRACALSFDKRFIVKILHTETGPLIAPDHAALEQFGFSFSDHLDLTDAGLLAASTESVINARKAEKIECMYQGKKTVFKSLENAEGNRHSIRDGISVTFLTTAGIELASLIEPSPNWEYVALLTQRFKLWGVDLTIAR